jgi:hypothetical protein
MSRRVRGTALAAGLILICGLLGLRVVGDRPEAQSAIYTLPQVEDGLDHHPAAWVGKALRVRATLTAANVSCTSTVPCRPHPIYLLVNTLSDSLFTALEIQAGAADRWMQALERIPLLGALVPRRPAPGGDGVYQLRLVPVSQGFTCFRNRCYRGILLGPMPSVPS